jgi:prepilin-type N-terminal cleavage/methylation domain-containing protein
MKKHSSTLAPKTQQSGFTLVELLVVIGILGIIMAVTIIAINPAQQFQNARNAQRQADVSTILDAIYEYEATNAGALPPGATNVSTTPKDLGALAAQTASSTSFATPNLTFNGLSGNIILTGGSVTVSGCTQAGDNGTWAVVSGTATTLTVSDVGGSAISATGCSISAWTQRIDLCANLVPTFIAAMPMDPSGSSGTQCATTYKTGYQIAINAAGNRYTVNAPSAENSATISVTR